jgi:hypothetical protein
VIQPHFPIFITSKGRYEEKYARTMRLFAEWDIDYYLCVEEHEFQFYKKYRPADRMLIYPSTGIGRARQFTLDMAREFDAGAFWAVDDDISAVRLSNESVSKMKIDPKIMIQAFEKRMEEDDQLGVIAPQYTNVLWRVQGDELVNAQCPGLFMLCRVVPGIDFDPELTVGEEIDWAYKHALWGNNTCVISNVYSIDTQVIGKKPGKVGGISYANDEMVASMAILEKRWGRFVTRRGDKLIKNWSRIRKALADGSYVRS